MSDSESEKEKKEKKSKLEAVSSFIGEQALKGKLLIEHSVGLGAKPNVIPPGEASVNGDMRTVHIGWHPVAGLGGKWFAEKTGIGKMITENIHHYPDPTQHWAVLVDDYVHELWIDENLEVIYINEKLVETDWKTFVVGKTHFNDEALRQAAEMTIHQMRSTRPGYNLISNNCQHFALALLDAIQVGAHKKFATSFAVYQRATGKGSIKDLFVDDGSANEPEGQQEQQEQPEQQQQQQQQQGTEGQQDDDFRPPKLQHANTMQTAQQIMDKYTTKLDRHYHGFFHHHHQS